MPPGEHWGRACHELNARIPPISESLVELVETHGDEPVECVSLELGQSPLSDLMLYKEPVIPAVLCKATVAQQGPDQDLLLPTC